MSEWGQDAGSSASRMSGEIAASSTLPPQEPEDGSSASPINRKTGVRASNRASEAGGARSATTGGRDTTNPLSFGACMSLAKAQQKLERRAQRVLDKRTIQRGRDLDALARLGGTMVMEPKWLRVLGTAKMHPLPPDGGSQAWLRVFGYFLVCTGTLGLQYAFSALYPALLGRGGLARGVADGDR